MEFMRLPPSFCPKPHWESLQPPLQDSHPLSVPGPQTYPNTSVIQNVRPHLPTHSSTGLSLPVYLVVKVIIVMPPNIHTNWGLYYPHLWVMIQNLGPNVWPLKKREPKYKTRIDSMKRQRSKTSSKIGGIHLCVYFNHVEQQAHECPICHGSAHVLVWKHVQYNVCTAGYLVWLSGNFTLLE